MTSEIEVKEFNGFVYKRKKIPKVEAVKDETSTIESIQDDSMQEESIQQAEPSIISSIEAEETFQTESEFLDTVVLDDSIDMSSILEQDILPDIESILMKPKRKRSSIYSKPSIPESIDPSNYHKLINPDLPELVKLKQLFIWLIKSKSKSFPNPVNFNPNSTDPIIKAIQQDLLGFEFDFKNELSPNPKNEELKDRIMLFKTQIDRYDQEISDWNSLLTHYTNLNAEQKQQPPQLFINTDLDLYKPDIKDSFKKQYYSDLHQLHLLKTKSKAVMKQLDDVKSKLLKNDEKVDAKDVLQMLSL
ncbi:hypothetical protein HK103_002963 [Boothiomyces macroporosus]|uniref:Uncharacterized protein n=1 Tax=Boothiomyces macroporosus TaxID=261099 RepID=A0AAD5Y997_9FUNG|nr:hypothetical protein HK103_002963 [Boothiomyces macroporosus]